MALTKAKISFLEGLTGAQLTGAMPVLDGSSLTGISGMTKVTSDPAVNTNPSSGVGTTWVNKSSGEMFICTNATTDGNIWKNVGGGIYGYGKCFGGLGGGTVSGYMAGGDQQTNIHKYSYSSSGNSTIHGTLSSITYMSTACSSTTHGYSAGGVTASNPQTTAVERYAFASSSNGAIISGMTVSSNKQDMTGHSSSTHGYIAGGTSPQINVIERFSYSDSNPVTDHGDLTRAQHDAAGASSITHGYCIGGHNSTVIDRYLFASSGRAVVHGSTLNAYTGRRGGYSSNTHGFISQGDPSINTVERFSFASDSTSIDYTNLSVGRSSASSTSSTTHGFTAGGAPNEVGSREVIDKFAFVSPGATAADVGDLTGGGNKTYGAAGHQF